MRGKPSLPAALPLFAFLMQPPLARVLDLAGVAGLVVQGMARLLSALRRRPATAPE